MPRVRPFLAILCLLAAVPAVAGAAHASGGHAASGAHGTHVALLLGGSHVLDEGRDGATFGIDIEREFTPRIGVGAVVEHAGNDVDATTLLAVVDWHIMPGFVFQFGPGVEFEREREVEFDPVHGTEVRTRTEHTLVGRAGFFYEIDIGGEWSIAPSVNLDVTERHETLVWGIALGRRFR